MFNKKQKHRHFRMSDEDLSEVFHSPIKLFFLVVVVLTITLCVVILIKIDVSNKTPKTFEQVFSEKIKQNQERLINSYVQDAGLILSEYVPLRQEIHNLSIIDCQTRINQYVDQVLDLTVPVDYKKFHLNLVVLMDKDMKVCGQQSDQLNQAWQDFLDEYNWLDTK